MLSSSSCSFFPKRPPRLLLVVAPALVLMLGGCKQEVAKEAAPPRPVRTVVVEKGGLSRSIVLTGQIQAEKEVALAFRIGGRIIERTVDAGDSVRPDQVVAKLDPQNELNALRSARATLSAAKARLEQDSNHFNRQETLLEQGWTTRANFDQAQQALRTAQATVDDAKAQVEIAEDRVGYTQLKAGLSGTVTRRAAESGEVVQPGQTVFIVARGAGWDAVFDVPAQLLRTGWGDADVIIALTDDPAVTAKGSVRQVDPQADPVTRTFRVRVAVNDPPPAMRLGATVSGRVEVDHGHGISLPASALTSKEKTPAVWVVDPDSLTVVLKPVEVLRFDPGTVVLSGGLDGGEIVVTAGVQALHPGQKVRPLGVRS
jgi:RND family efflux transporter MFP subunit